jgi:hypothetical protein
MFVPPAQVLFGAASRGQLKKSLYMHINVVYNYGVSATQPRRLSVPIVLSSASAAMRAFYICD